MVKKEVVKRKKGVKAIREMPPGLKFVYWYNVIWISLVCLLGILIFFFGFALVSIILWLLAYLRARFLTRDLRRAKDHAYWLNLIFSVLVVLGAFVEVVSLNGLNIVFLFEIIIIYCLLRKDSRDFFK